MNEREYMQQLRELICGEPDEFQNDILETFRLHFEQGHSEGRTDQEIIEELGLPEEVYEGICRLYEDADKTEKKETEKEKKNQFNSLFAILKEHIFQSQNSEKREYKIIAGEYISHLSIQASSSNIIMQHGSSLGYAWSPDDNKLPDAFKMNAQGESLSIVLQGNGTLYLQIPAHVHAAAVQASSGDIHCENLVLKQLQIINHSGDINLVNADISRAELISNSGDQQLDNCRIHSLSSRASSGDIVIHPECQIIHSEICTNSGDIRLSSAGNFECINLKTSSGDVEIIIKEKGTAIYAETSNGDIDNHTSFDVNPLNNSYSAMKDTRNVITICTASGDIHLREN